MYVFVLFFISCIGGVLILGSYKRWKWLVDPPIEWAWFYSQSWIKKKFGQKFLLVYTYFSGMVFIVIGIAGVVFGTEL